MADTSVFILLTAQIVLALAGVFSLPWAGERLTRAALSLKMLVVSIQGWMSHTGGSSRGDSGSYPHDDLDDSSFSPDSRSYPAAATVVLWSSREV